MTTLKILSDYLRQIADRDAPFGGKMQRPATAEDLDVLSKRVQEQFNYSLPAAYLSLLAVADGVDFNGFTLYASHTQPLQGEEKIALQGFAEINEFWQEYADNQDHHLLMFGETGDDLYLFDQRAQTYQVTDKVSGDAYQTFDTFEELAEQLFKNALGLVEEEDEQAEA